MEYLVPRLFQPPSSYWVSSAACFFFPLPLSLILYCSHKLSRRPLFPFSSSLPVTLRTRDDRAYPAPYRLTPRLSERQSCTDNYSPLLPSHTPLMFHLEPLSRIFIALSLYRLPTIPALTPSVHLFFRMRVCETTILARNEAEALRPLGPPTHAVYLHW